MKFVLVRHGETEWNKLGKFQGQVDVALNARGLSQAKETAQAVVCWKPSVVYSSPLRRTMQVAQEISRLSGMPVVGVDGFKELKLGSLEGLTGEEMEFAWPELLNAWRDDPASVLMPSGESLGALQDRVWNSLLELEQLHPGDANLVVVSHNFAIRAAIYKVLGAPLTNFHCMSLSLSSISVIESDLHARRLIAHNSTCHLSPVNQ